MRAAGLLLAVLALGLGAMPATAAALEVPPGGAGLEILNAAGAAETRAGVHPYRLIQRFQFRDSGGVAEDPKEMVFELPAGLGGDPNAVPLCTRGLLGEVACPAESQVGILYAGNSESESQLPLYGVEAGPNEAVVFGAVPFLPLKMLGTLRTEDQGLALRLEDLEQSTLPPREGRIELWGVPADHQEGTAIPRRALLTTPTSCERTGLTARIRARTWQRPGLWVEGSGSTGLPTSDCAALPFAASLGFALDNPVADTPTGARVDLVVPQNGDPDGRASSQIKDVSIALPEGIALSLGGAAGLSLCDDAQLGLGSSGDATCPGASRIGTVEIESATKPLTGNVYLGQGTATDRFRVFVVAAAPGAQLKFVGALRPDPQSGRLTVSLKRLPQVAFKRMTLRFDGGPGALLATPLGCGAATTAATFVPYSGTAPLERTASATVAARSGGCGGAPAFAPGFSGGSTSAAAGRATSFTTTVRRRDGEQLPDRLEIAFPPGVSAALGTVARCAASAAAAAACPAESRIGHAIAELGPGSTPGRIEGDAYLTAPYRDAPFGLALVFKARVGPFDLGTMVVRGTLRADPLSGQVSVRTDPLPRVFEGIPIRFQTIALDIDRPGFIRNPTSCAPAQVVATLRSATGATARIESPFSVRGCIDLRFRPRFETSLEGRSQLHDGGRPGLKIATRLPAGDASMRKAEILLPRLLRFDASGLSEICARAQALSGRCPKGSRVGSGSARSPLLDGRLRGSIYVVQPPGDGSPDLWTDLHGGGLEVRIRAETATAKGRMETRLVDLPDFPLASFSMRLSGGDHGMLRLRHHPCAGARDARALSLRIEGHNGAQQRQSNQLAVPGGCRG